MKAVKGLIIKTLFSFISTVGAQQNAEPEPSSAEAADSR